MKTEDLKDPRTKHLAKQNDEIIEVLNRIKDILDEINKKTD